MGLRIAALLIVNSMDLCEAVSSKMLHVVSSSTSVVSSQSSSSKGAEASSTADKAGPAQLDMDEDVAGLRSRNLSSTLQKLYLWEKKLYNEVKVCCIMLNYVDMASLYIIQIPLHCYVPTCFSYNTKPRSSHCAKDISFDPFGGFYQHLGDGLLFQICAFPNSLCSSLSCEHGVVLQSEEKMRVDHDRKVDKLKRLDERGAEAHKVDTTRTLIRSLSTKIGMAIQVVDKISVTVNKIRDEELWPQLNELIQGYVVYKSWN